MSTEIWVAIISGVVGIATAILTFIATNRKTKIEQFQRMEDYHEKLQAQIIAFQKDTRIEVSRLQDSVAEQKLVVEGLSDLINYRLNELEKKQDKHNNLIERVYKLESQVGVLNERKQA